MNCKIGYSEAETFILKHELEKALLTQQSLEKEVELLRKQITQLEQINPFKKKNKMC